LVLDSLGGVALDFESDGHSNINLDTNIQASIAGSVCRLDPIPTAQVLGVRMAPADLGTQAPSTYFLKNRYLVPPVGYLG
jgi:hypothetical protein